MKDVSRWGKFLSLPLPSEKHLLSAARRGIPHGSTCSPLVSSYCMRQLPWHPVPELVLVNYSDDFLLMAHSKSTLQKAGPVLVEAVGDLPGGHFKLERKCELKADEGFAFLGHQFRLQHGCLKISPTEKNINAFWKTLAELDERVSKFIYTLEMSKKDAFPLAVEALARLAAYVQGWRAAFAECDNPDRWLGGVQEEVATYRKKLGISSRQLQASIDPTMIGPEDIS